MADFQGTSDDDNFVGTHGSDTFHMEDGEFDIVFGSHDNDFIFFGASFNGTEDLKYDYVGGGQGYDVLYLAGDYTERVLFEGANLKTVEEIYLQGNVAGLPTTYKLRFTALHDENVYINGTTLVADDRLKVDVARALTTAFTIDAGASKATIKGGDRPLTVVTSSSQAQSIGGSSKGDTFTWNSPEAPRTAQGAGSSGFNTNSAYDGAAGKDTLYLHGDMSAGVTFNATTIANIETIVLMPGFSYDLKLDDSNVAAGARLAVNGGAISAAGSFFHFNGSSESDGSFTILGGFRGGTYKTGAGDDVIDVGAGGVNTILPGSGADEVLGDSNQDIVRMGAFFDALDRINGGSEISDEIAFDGDYSALVDFRPGTVTNIDIFRFAKGNDYAFKLEDENLAAGRTLIVEASVLKRQDSLSFDGRDETDGLFDFRGGNGKDVLKGGAKDDDFHGGGGDDKIHVGLGSNDLFYDGPASNSSGRKHDVVYGFDGNRDWLNVDDFPSVTQVNTGSLSQASFDADVATAVGSLAAVAFVPDAGDLAGHHYLIVEKNGVSGYQEGGDLVIEFDNPADWGTFNFFTL